MKDMAKSNVKDFFDKWACKWDEYSKENDELIDKYIGLLNIRDNDKILDVACGTGVITKRLENTKAREIHAVDISEKMIAIANEKIKSQKVYFHAEDFLLGGFSGFDSLVMYNALPHFVHREKLQTSIAKAVKSGGKVLVCHGIGKEKINSCHSGVMDISSKLEAPQSEFAHFCKDFKLLECKDEESEYYFLMERI